MLEVDDLGAWCTGWRRGAGREVERRLAMGTSGGTDWLEGRPRGGTEAVGRCPKERVEKDRDRRKEGRRRDFILLRAASATWA